MPRKNKDTPVGITTIRCPGNACPHVEIDWERNEASIIDDFGGECKFTSLTQLWALSSRISVALCDGSRFPGES